LSKIFALDFLGFSWIPSPNRAFPMACADPGEKYWSRAPRREQQSEVAKPLRRGRDAPNLLALEIVAVLAQSFITDGRLP
jgi:hypothetical protein